MNWITRYGSNIKPRADCSNIVVSRSVSWRDAQLVFPAFLQHGATGAMTDVLGGRHGHFTRGQLAATLHGPHSDDVVINRGRSLVSQRLTTAKNVAEAEPRRRAAS